jgi:hypothetical protein
MPLKICVMNESVFFDLFVTRIPHAHTRTRTHAAVSVQCRHNATEETQNAPEQAALEEGQRGHHAQHQDGGHQHLCASSYAEVLAFEEMN